MLHQGAHSGRGIFLVNFRKTWLLWNVAVHFDCEARTKSVSGFWAQSGPRHFSCKFPYNVALVKCWLAFRARRLAQSVRLGSGPRHFPFKFLYKVALVKCWLACRLRRLAQSVRLGLGSATSPVNFCAKWLLWNVVVQARTKFAPRLWARALFL